MQEILITGGAGYVATHACVALAAAGYDPVLVDNLCNSKREAVHRVEKIIGRSLPFYAVDVRDRAALAGVFSRHAVGAVLHFAGLKSVAESVSNPLAYYENNVAGTLALVDVMGRAGVKQLVFSSSATVYGDPVSVPIGEDFAVGRTANPYGHSKLMIEDILRDVQAADAAWRIALLRYFNPVGAHPSGLIGEDPNGTPSNLMPYLSQVAVGKLPYLQVYGGDYPTPDGTGVRDYIHVMDLAQGHVAALRHVREHSGLITVNLGTGRGYSVLEMVAAFERASRRKVPVQMAARRPGDIASCYANPALAERLLGWRAEKGIDEMCADAWRWQAANPTGYEVLA